MGLPLPLHASHSSGSPRRPKHKMTLNRRNKYTTGASSSRAAGTASPSKRQRRENKEASALEEAEDSLPLDVENDEDANSINEQGAQLVSPPAADRSPEERNRKQQRSTRAAAPRKSQTQIEYNNGNDGVGNDEEAVDAVFIGLPIPQKEAKQRWPHRYRIKNAQRRSITSDGNDESEEKMQARGHYSQAKVDGRVLYNLNDCAHVQAAPGEPNYVCRIVEIFEGVDGNRYFTAQWFYRPSDTVIGTAYQMDNKYVFLSEIKDDNPLDCLVEKLNIAMLDLEEKNRVIPQCNYYCDMLYLLPYSTFVKLPPEYRAACSESLSTISSEVDSNAVNSEPGAACGTGGNEVTLLDLYSGCGAMSTGLCLGAKKSGANLVTRWAVDINQFACKSLELNHPETKVRNEKAEDFLELLKEWRRLCVSFSLVANGNGADECQPYEFRNVEDEEEDDDDDDNDEDDPEAFEVEKIIKICYGDPKNNEKCGLYFMVHWKGYDSSYDTWEPVGGLMECGRAVNRFVAQGYKDKILPLQGDVDVICGGPPCQGISGFNRFRNRENPLADVKNKQLLVFMDIVDYLKPKFVLMENVVDILKFAEGFLGRYALGRLIEMKYQTRMGLLAAGCYGLPQFRMRFFLWGALHCEKLPQYPLPTHDVVVRGVVPVKFESHVVAYDAGLPVNLEKKLTLEDAISDLPEVGNDESRDVMRYDKEPCTEFQRLIRLNKDVLASPSDTDFLDTLFDHRPLQLNVDDYERTCKIPQKKGANFRDLPGVKVRPDKRVEFDPEVERAMLKSGKPLVPDYAMTFVHGSSTKPFARLWWDETVPTVVTRAEPHNQAILHPKQDRVLSVRENARLQGFPDYYQLHGPVKERYIQVGNAVAVPVARALGYSLGLALQGSAGDEPLFSLPKKFPHLTEQPSSASSDNDY